MNDMTQPQNAFSLSPHYREILDQADRFARKELHPLLPKMDDEEWWPEHLFPFLGENGFLGVTVPEAIGRRRARPLRPGAGRAGVRALERECGAQHPRPRQPVREQPAAQRLAGAAAEVPAGPVQGNAGRRARPHRAGCRVPTRWAACAPPRGARATITCLTAASSSSPTGRSPT